MYTNQRGGQFGLQGIYPVPARACCLVKNVAALPDDRSGRREPLADGVSTRQELRPALAQPPQTNSVAKTGSLSPPTVRSCNQKFLPSSAGWRERSAATSAA